MINFLLLFLTVLAGIACSSQNNIKNLTDGEQDKLIQLKEPDSKTYEKQPLYITSVQQKKYNGENILLIKGNLPNGCTHLMQIKHELKNRQTVLFNMTAWKEPGTMCTQQLVPFTYVYKDLPPGKLRSLTHFQYNNETFNIK